MPNQIIIQQQDQYLVENNHYFTILIENKKFRDISINPNKIDVYMLKILLSHAKVPSVYKLKKAELVNLFNQWYVFQ